MKPTAELLEVAMREMLSEMGRGSRKLRDEPAHNEKVLHAAKVLSRDSGVGLQRRRQCPGPRGLRDHSTRLPNWVCALLERTAGRLQ
jgi:hypothetical protein